MIDPALILLAAGDQRRWSGGKAKCLAEVGAPHQAQSLLVRLAEQFRAVYRHGSVVIVARPNTIQYELAAIVEPLGPSIGDSVLAGLNGVSTAAIVVAADTYLPDPVRVLQFGSDVSATLFDPWAWVTVQFVAAKDRDAAQRAACLEPECRIRMARHWPGPTVLLKTGARNVNTTADLERLQSDV